MVASHSHPNSIPFSINHAGPHRSLCAQLAEACMAQRYLIEALTLQQIEPELVENTEAQSLVARALKMLRQNTTQLAELLDPLHGSSHELRESSARLAGMFVGCICKRRTREVPAMLRDDYAILNFVAMSYTILHTNGLAIRDMATASLALTHLQHLVAVSQDIARLMPSLVVRELQGLLEDLPKEAEQTASVNIQAAWRNSASAA